MGKSHWGIPKGLWDYRLIKPRIRGGFKIFERAGHFCGALGTAGWANSAPCHAATNWIFDLSSRPCRFWPVIWPVLAWKNIAAFWKPPGAMRLQYLFAPTYWPTKSRNCGAPLHNMCPAIFLKRIFCTKIAWMKSHVCNCSATFEFWLVQLIFLDAAQKIACRKAYPDFLYLVSISSYLTYSMIWLF